MKTNKQLKEAYKQMKFPAGVFQIRNLQNGKVFISSSANLDTAWNSQRFKLNAGLHPNQLLQNDWKQSMEENFAYEILETIENEEQTISTNDLKALEALMIEIKQPFGHKGYHKMG